MNGGFKGNEKEVAKRLRDYWDEHLEHNPLREKTDTDAGAFLAWQLEAVGDIIRELGNDIPDPAYIQGKIDRIRGEWQSPDWSNPLSQGEQERLAQVRDAIKNFPFPSALASNLKLLIGAIAYRDTLTVQRYLKAVQDELSARVFHHRERTKDPYR